MNEKPLSKPTSSDNVTLRDLARELGATIAHCRMLIDCGYVVPVSIANSLGDTIVVRPDPFVADWMRIMFRPLPQRPLIPVSAVARIVGLAIEHVRSMCAIKKIQCYLDPVFGEVMCPRDAARIRSQIHGDYHPQGYSRQDLLEIFNAMSGLPGPQRRRRAPSVEREIQRISRLPEPGRTIRAAAFWESYCEARTINECLERASKQYKKSKRKVTLDAMVTEMGDALSGVEPWVKTAREEAAERARRRRASRAGHISYRQKQFNDLPGAQQDELTALRAHYKEVRFRILSEGRLDYELAGKPVPKSLAFYRPENYGPRPKP